MEWWSQPPGSPPPLVEWRDEMPLDGIALSDEVTAFFMSPGNQARLAEFDGLICATLVGGTFAEGDAYPGLERIDLILRPSRVLLRRRSITGTVRAASYESIARLWERSPPGQRDASVLFFQILNAVIDSSSDVLDEIRRRVDTVEERLLDPNPAINEILAEVLTLNRTMGGIRDSLLPLRGDIRELTELRDPVDRGLISAAGGRWLRSVEMDLTTEVPAALQSAEARIAGAAQQVQGERSEATNRVVLLLTIITVAFFVPTLLTGLYGMNTPLPGKDDGWIFWGVVAIAGTFLLVAAATVTLLGLWGTFRSVLPGRMSMSPNARDARAGPPERSG